MLVLDAEAIRARCRMRDLIDALRVSFGGACTLPPRQMCSIPGGAGARLLLAMPAFDADGSGAVKLVTFLPDNATRGLPTVQGVVIVFAETGAPVALLDGTIITRLRTGATSALASSYLSQAKSQHLVIIGTGALAPYMAAAHCAVRPISRISICGRDAARAEAAARGVRALIGERIAVVAGRIVEEVVASADIVSCATTSATPVLAGAWLRPGVFVDLVGSFSPDKRECDDEVMRRSRIFVDTFAGALAEAGDLLDPLRRGIIGRERIEAELADLVTGRVIGRRSDEEIITFKSVGAALEDLAAARLIVAGMCG